MASAYEKRVMVDQALELYAETLKPPQFNYNNDEFQDAMVELKRVQYQSTGRTGWYLHFFIITRRAIYEKKNA
eukprot:scaffold37109_cov58-Cyclotella_meneghiniana.AAC.2